MAPSVPGCMPWRASCGRSTAVSPAPSCARPCYRPMSATPRWRTTSSLARRSRWPWRAGYRACRAAQTPTVSSLCPRPSAPSPTSCATRPTENHLCAFRGADARCLLALSKILPRLRCSERPANPLELHLFGARRVDSICSYSNCL